MDIKQDPQSIPNWNSTGRIGELQPNEPEQAQSSVELDPSADGDGAVSTDTSTGSGEDSPLDNGSSATVRPEPPDMVAEPPRGAEPGSPADPSRRRAGAIDGP
ncbi:MAG TPA: hypothetical protein VF457_01810 [Burkholderiaceae bacterium]